LQAALPEIQNVTPTFKKSTRARGYALGLSCFLSGGAGNRTPVREEIDHSHYVRSPLLDVSGRWLADGPLPDKPSRSRPMTEGASSAYPGFPIPVKPPRAGFLTGTRR